MCQGELGEQADTSAMGGIAPPQADTSAVGTIHRPLQVEEDVQKEEQALDEAVGMISDAHRRLAAMMRATAPGAPYRLERDGLMHAIHTMLEHDFQNAFDEVCNC